MTYDAANVIGYMLGASHEYLTTGLRDKALYNYKRCKGNDRRKYIRNLCLVRAAILDNLDGENFLMEIVRKGIYPEAHMFAKHVLLKLPEMEKNPTKLNALKVIQRELWARINEAWFASLCRGIDLDPEAARDLFWFDISTNIEPRGVDFFKRRQELGCPVYAFKMSAKMIKNDDQLRQVLGIPVTIGVQGVEPHRHKETEDPALRPFVKANEPGKFPPPFDLSSAEQMQEVSMQAGSVAEFRAFCLKYQRIVIEVDSENMEAELALPLIALAQDSTEVRVFVHIADELNKGWCEHCANDSSGVFQMVHAEKLTSETKNQVDMSAMVHAIKEKLSDPSLGVVVFSSDSDFIMLPSNITASDVCVCCRKGVTSQRYMDKLCELGSTVVPLVPDMVGAEDRVQEYVHREYFITLLNKLLPNLRECYDSVIMTSHKPAFEDIEWSITPQGNLLAK